MVNIPLNAYTYIYMRILFIMNYLFNWQFRADGRISSTVFVLTLEEMSKDSSSGNSSTTTARCHKHCTFEVHTPQISKCNRDRRGRTRVRRYPEDDRTVCHLWTLNVSIESKKIIAYHKCPRRWTFHGLRFMSCNFNEETTPSGRHDRSGQSGDLFRSTRWAEPDPLRRLPFSIFGFPYLLSLFI